MLGVAYHKATTRLSVERVRDDMQKQMMDRHEVYKTDVMQAEAKALWHLRTPPPPKAEEELLSIALDRIAAGFHRRLFPAARGSKELLGFACARVSAGALMRQSVDVKNATWHSLPDQAPQNEYMTKCYQKISVLAEAAAANFSEHVYLVLDTNEFSSARRDETEFLADALKWMHHSVATVKPLCSRPMTEVLDNLPPRDSFLIAQQRDGCHLLEKRLCARASAVLQFGGEAPNPEYGPAVQHFPHCGHLKVQLRRGVRRIVRTALRDKLDREQTDEMKRKQKELDVQREVQIEKHEEQLDVIELQQEIDKQKKDLQRYQLEQEEAQET
ncbi:hypothetical protein DIPPA_02208 [Diplonema papillatum]|nr:hypothetical protein DIPPA_02208 [Diplonema papillatum]